MSTKTDNTTRQGSFNFLKHKVGKLHNARKRLSTSSRSKSSPALMVIGNSGPTAAAPKLHRQKSITDEIPHCDTIIDLTVLKGDALQKAVQDLIATLFSASVNPYEHGIQLERVSGAMTNAVFFVTMGSKRMLLRVYGVGCEQILDRNKELDWLSRLSQLHIGPRLLGIFGNGRFEEYLPSVTLTRQDIRQPEISTRIASRLHQLHAIVDTFPPAPQEPLEVWTNIDKWYTALSTELAPLLSKNPQWHSKMQQLDVIQLRSDIDLCKQWLKKEASSPIVFAHNDTQYGNILKINGTGELVVIDFEYAGYNPRGFDIANHFCEWMYDYHSKEEPAQMHLDQYPTMQEQMRFLSCYAHSEDTTELTELQREVDGWKMACHLFWGLWGLVQASQSEIDFDYFYYSMQRIAEFRKDLKNK